MGLAVDTAQWQCYIQNNNFQLKFVFLFHSFMGLLIMKRSIEKKRYNFTRKTIPAKCIPSALEYF